MVVIQKLKVFNIVIKLMLNITSKIKLSMFYKQFFLISRFQYQI